MAPECLRRTQLSEVGWQSIPHPNTKTTQCACHFWFSFYAYAPSPGIMFSSCPFVRSSGRSFVCYQTCEHDILKTNEPILIQIGRIQHAICIEICKLVRMQ